MRLKIEINVYLYSFLAKIYYISKKKFHKYITSTFNSYIFLNILDKKKFWFYRGFLHNHSFTCLLMNKSIDLYIFLNILDKKKFWFYRGFLHNHSFTCLLMNKSIDLFCFPFVICLCSSSCFLQLK